MKINLARISVKNLNGGTETVDIKKEFCNVMYFRGKSIDEVELARRLYHGDGDVEVSEAEAKLIVEAVNATGYGYVIKQAVIDTLKERKE